MIKTRSFQKFVVYHDSVFHPISVESRAVKGSEMDSFHRKVLFRRLTVQPSHVIAVNRSNLVIQIV